jgi:PAS domain S-box-containing protein
MQDRHTHFSFGERLKYLPVLLNSVDNPVLVINQEGKVIFANPAAFRLTGWQLNGQLHDDIDNISGLPSLKTIAEELNQRLQEGKPSLETIIIPGNNGDEINYIVQVSSIESNRDQYICLVFDIPESEISQKLNEANEILIEVDNLLGDVVDYDAMLKKLVEYVIPNLADMSVIHVIQPDGSLEAVAFAPASMNQNRAILDWLEDDLPNDEIDGLPAVIDNNESVLIPYVSQASRTGKAGIKSYMILPLITHRQIRGTMTFISLQECPTMSEVNFSTYGGGV